MKDESNRQNRLPDLPGLESVDAYTHVGLWYLPEAICILLIGLMAGGIGWMYVKNRAAISADSRSEAAVIVGLVSIGMLVVWILYKVLWTEHRWVTDADGLRSYSVLRKRFIPWTELVEIRPPRVVSSARSYRAVGRHQSIGLMAHNLTCALLVASVYQHAARRIPVSPQDMPEHVLSLWDSIPDDLPRRLDWRNPRPPSVPLARLCWYAILALAISDIALFFTPHRDWALIAALYLVMGTIGARTRLRTTLASAHEFSMDDDGFSARTGRGSTKMRWAEDLRAQMTTYGLALNGRNGEIRLPYNPLKPVPESSQLILAAIRRLRETDSMRLIEIPQGMRLHKPIAYAACSEDPVEVRSTWFERVMVPFAPLMFTIMAALGTRDTQMRYGAAIGMALTFLLLTAYAFVAMSAYAIRVDASGVEKRCLWWRRSIAWPEVTDYDLRESGYDGRPLHVYLKDANGRTLVNASPGVGSGKDRARFVACLHRHLEKLLPEEVYRKPYLARPFDLEASE